MGTAAGRGIGAGVSVRAVAGAGTIAAAGGRAGVIAGGRAAGRASAIAGGRANAGAIAGGLRLRCGLCWRNSGSIWIDRRISRFLPKKRG